MLFPRTIEVRFGLTVCYTPQRVLPTAGGLFKQDLNLNFDRLQNSALDMATPLAVLHASVDGQWLYAVTPLSSGWVRAEDVALCSRWQLQHYLAAPDFVVTPPAKTDLYGDPALTSYHGRLRMGVRLPRWRNGHDGVQEVLVPRRLADGSCTFRPAWVRCEDVHPGYLPLTPRNAIHQAFRLLNAPYGWGGMYGEQDCSRFIQEVFACFGVRLPRNSSQQARAGLLMAEFEDDTPPGDRLAALAKVLPGVTTLYLNGHIMLLVGFEGGMPYAIHDMWAYSENHGGQNHLKIMNRTVISSLLLGRDTPGGSLLARLKSARYICIPK